jgi:hypothetical protein
MAERNDKTNSMPTNTAGADKTTNTIPTKEANPNAGKEGELDREGRQPIGKAHTADEHLHGQDDRNQVTNTPKDGTADRKRTDGPTSNTDERHQTGKHSTGNDARNSDGTDRADQKVGGDAARTVAGDDTRKADKDRTEQPTAGTHSKDKR